MCCKMCTVLCNLYCSVNQLCAALFVLYYSICTALQNQLCAVLFVLYLAMCTYCSVKFVLYSIILSMTYLSKNGKRMNIHLYKFFVSPAAPPLSIPLYSRTLIYIKTLLYSNSSFSSRYRNKSFQPNLTNNNFQNVKSNSKSRKSTYIIFYIESLKFVQCT